MPGKILVAHGAAIERDFLRRALAVDRSADLPVVWLDTLMLERSLATNRGKEGKDYRLCQIRQEKGLPGYLAHNALADSVATGGTVSRFAQRDICRFAPHPRSSLSSFIVWPRLSGHFLVLMK